MKKKDLKITINTVVHCATEELANEVLKVAHDLGYAWSNKISYLDENNYIMHKKNTCYDLMAGEYSRIAYYEEMPYKIITAEEFLNLHNCKFEEKTEVLESSEKLPMYRGDKKRGKEIIEALKKIGGINDHYMNGCSEGMYYFITKNKKIRVANVEDMHPILTLSFELTELPSNKEIIKFTLSAENYDRMICKNGEIWVVRIFDSFHRSFWMDSAGHTWKKALPFNNETKKLISTPNQPDVEYKFVECLTDENK